MREPKTVRIVRRGDPMLSVGSKEIGFRTRPSGLGTAS